MKQQRTSNPAGNVRGYRSRYKAFIEERHSGGRSRGRDDGSQGQGMVNLAIFIALFLAILTLFGFGLSRINRAPGEDAGTRSEELSRQRQSTPAAMTPPPTVYPSGHAEVRTRYSSSREAETEAGRRR